jgi:hypothetical protein
MAAEHQLEFGRLLHGKIGGLGRLRLGACLGAQRVVPVIPCNAPATDLGCVKTQKIEQP